MGPTSELHENLTKIRRRCAAASPAPWTVERDGDGAAVIRTGRAEGENRLIVRRDHEPASEADVRFIALARTIVERLVDAVERGEAGTFSAQELDEIDAAVAGASSPPWVPFLESTQPIGGSSVIWIGGERDDEPDMYVWLGEDRRAAPDPDVEFIAQARQDVPELLAAARQLRR
jgi:hypothetical protein